MHEAHIKPTATLVFTLLSLVGSYSFLWATDEPRRLVAVVDYVAGDYKNAVRAGQVINQDEYREMIEFSARALDLARELRAAEKADRAGVAASLNELAAQIKKRVTRGSSRSSRDRSRKN